MLYLIIGGLILAVLLYSGHSFTHSDPAMLARRIRLWGGFLCLALGAVMALTGRVAFAVPLVIIGGSFLARAGYFRRSSGRATQRILRSSMLEVAQNASGEIVSGRVLSGAFTGRALDSLDRADAFHLWRETAQDPDSRRLVEAYLDSWQPFWREDFQADGAQGHGRATGSGAMTDEEAYQILGLSRNASDTEIRAAYRRLMKRLHPDSGGSAFLAARLNEAKDRLLGRH